MNRWHGCSSPPPPSTCLQFHRVCSCALQQTLPGKHSLAGQAVSLSKVINGVEEAAHVWGGRGRGGSTTLEKNMYMYRYYN